MPQHTEIELRVGMDTRRHPKVPSGGSSESDYSTLAHKVVDRLGVRDPERAELLTSFGDFFQILTTVTGPRAIGFIRRDENYVRPILDVYVLWSSMDITSPSQGEAMNRLVTTHGTLARSLSPYVDSLLEFVNPISYPALHEFRAALRQWAREAKKGCVIAYRNVARIDRKTS